MKATINKNSETEAVISIKADKSDLALPLRETYKHLRPQVKADGFRPGRAPDNIVERELGSQHVQEHFLEDATRQLYTQAIKQENLRPLGAPHVEVKKFVPYTELELELKVEIMPEVKLPDYKKIKKAPAEIKVSDEEVSKVIEGLRSRGAKRSEVNRAAQTGDEIVIDMEGKRDGKLVPGAKASDYGVLLGSERFVPGFETQLVGLEAGEKKKFKVTFPADYPEPTLQSKEVEFDVKVKQVKEIDLPPVDDKFAATVGPFKGLEELQTDVKKQLDIEKSQDARRQLTDSIVEEIVSKSELELPPGLVVRQRQHLLQDFISNLQSQGGSQQDYLDDSGEAKGDLAASMQKDAQKRVKTALVLSAVAAAEKLGITPEELEIRLQLLKGRYPDKQAQAELDKPEVKADIADQLLIEKTVQRLVDYATS